MIGLLVLTAWGCLCIGAALGCGIQVAVEERKQHRRMDHIEQDLRAVQVRTEPLALPSISDIERQLSPLEQPGHLEQVVTLWATAQGVDEGRCACGRPGHTSANH